MSKITNWSHYNQALVNRGNIRFWFDEKATRHWYNECTHGGRGRSNHFSDLAIETCLTLKAVFGLSFRALQGFTQSVLSLMKLPLEAPTYSCLCKRSAELNIKFRSKVRTTGFVDIVVDSTGLKVFGEGEWHAQKHHVKARKKWRKLHLAVDANTHDIVGAQMTLSNVTDGETLQDLISPLRRRIDRVSADGAYDSRRCYAEITEKGAIPVIPPRENARLWTDKHPRNEAVMLCNKLGITQWKKLSGYHVRSLAETAMYRFKQLMGAKLNARDYNRQLVEAMIKVKALNKINTLGLPKYQ